MGRHPDDIPVPDVLIVRPDAQLYYANAQTFKNIVRDMIAAAEEPPSAVIIDASAQDEIDFTTIEMLIELVKQLQAKGIEIYLADVHAPVHEGTARSGLLDAMGGRDHVFPTVDAAVNHVQSET